MNIQQAIARVINKQDISFEDMQIIMTAIMSGEVTPAQIGGFLVGLRMKGETVDEIAAAASVMRQLSSKVDVVAEHMVDTCGTGGDGANTFNISTASAFVVAAAGGTVAKHGNRSVSSKSGSADVLEKLGVRVDLSAAEVKQCVEQVGIGFMFAPMHHSAMKHAIGPRKELATRTIFNLLGPLTNPAGAPNQVLGVYDKAWVEPVANVLKNLGSQHVLVVHGDGGLDEISISGPTDVAEVKQGSVQTYSVSPESFDIQRASLDTLAVDSVEQSAELLKGILRGEVSGPAQDIVALNAGAAIYAANLTNSLNDGVEMARDVLSLGTGYEKLTDLAAVSHGLKAI
ncbi:MAG: anthranilate phosphoribosyltransferase [Kangiellaceae bacterium]|nr:anthranilate phosphoribosyltransferase [Kangiellaceae bacterium]|tara:strand:- start:5490 stop:6518 length:1029 start_codon:yes stop_codon:yes gene_type:complete